MQRRHSLSRPRVDVRAQLHQRVRAQLHQRLPRVRRLPSAAAYLHLLTRVAAFAQAGGRASETALMSFRQLQWDADVQCVYVDVPQLKTKKVKKVAFFPGADREICWFVDFADNLCLELRTEKYDEATSSFLFSELFTRSCPGKVLGGYIKSLVEALPGVLTRSCAAAGFRAGVVNLLHQYVPESFACVVSGHSTFSEAFQQYLDASLAMCIPGAIVLMGWPPFIWGTNGAGPKPATLDAIKDLPLPFPAGAEFENIGALLETFADIHYTLSDLEYSPPQLVRGGALRPLVLAALATQVMYYTERVKAESMYDVHNKMRGVVMHLKLAPTLLEAHDLLGRWSALVKERFNMDNLHMTTRASDTGYQPLVNEMRKLKQEVTAARADATAAHAEATATRAQLNTLLTLLTTVSTQLSTQQAQISSLVAAQPPGATSAGLASPLPAAPAATPEQPAHVSPTTSAGLAPAAPAAPAQMSAAAPAAPAQLPAPSTGAGAGASASSSSMSPLTHRRPLRVRVPRHCWGWV